MAGIKKNIAYQTFYQIIALLLPLVTSPYISRILGAQQVGLYSYTYSIAYYFMLFALLGISNHGSRAIAVSKSDAIRLRKTFSDLLVLHIVIAAVAVAAYYTFVLTCVEDGKVYYLLQGLWVLGALFDVSWFYFGLEEFKTTVIRSTAIKIASAVFTFVFVKDSFDLWIYISIMAGGSFLSQIVLWPKTLKYIDLKQVSWQGIKLHIKPILLLFIPVIAVSLYRYMDKIMLGLMSSETQVGFYESAEKVISMPISVINSFGMVMFPRMAALIGEGDKARGKKYICISIEAVMCLAFAMAFGLIGVADRFSIVFWGQEFAACGNLIRLLSTTIPFMAFANVLRTQYLMPNSHDKIYIWSVCGGALINIIVNAIMIPKLEAAGAAIGTIFAETIVCVIQAISVKGELPIMKYIKEVVPFLMIGLFMCGTVIWIGHYIESIAIALMVQILLGVVVYSCICLCHLIKKQNVLMLQVKQKIMQKLHC